MGDAQRFRARPFSVTDPGGGRICVERRNGRVHLHNGKRRYESIFQYLRISFDCSGVWTAFDELTVMGKNGNAQQPARWSGTPDGPQNLALDKPYTVSPRRAGRLRRHRRQGVDRRIPSAARTCYDAAWQGHSGEWPLRTRVVDLGQICAVEQVRHEFPAESGSGICLPSRFSVYVSSDGLTWAALYDEKPPQRQTGVTRCNGWAAQASPAAKQTPPAWPRYVRAWTRS